MANMMIEGYVIFCLILVWLAGTAWGVYLMKTKFKVLFFPSVQATITDLRIIERATIESEAGSSKIELLLQLDYRFTLDGKAYTGDFEGGAYEFPGGSFKGKPGEKPLYKGKLTIGDNIPVYYNPDNPKESYHTRSYFISSIVIIAISQFFLYLAYTNSVEWFG